MEAKTAGKKKTNIKVENPISARQYKKDAIQRDLPAIVDALKKYSKKTA